MKEFIDITEFNRLLNQFQKEGWTKLGREYHQDFWDYFSSKEHLVYETNFSNLEPLGIDASVWSRSEYEVPEKKTGHLKKYRGFRILLLVLNNPPDKYGLKKTLGCFPLNKISNE